jgi:hypothetical protein
MVMVGSLGLGVRESGVNQQIPQKDRIVESHVSQKTRDMGHPFPGSGTGEAGHPPPWV